MKVIKRMRVRKWKKEGKSESGWEGEIGSVFVCVCVCEREREWDIVMYKHTWWSRVKNCQQLFAKKKMKNVFKSFFFLSLFSFDANFQKDPFQLLIYFFSFMYFFIGESSFIYWHRKVINGLSSSFLDSWVSQVRIGQ